MGKSWVAAGGRTITDEMVERWERELETREFFDKGVTVGGVVDGQPHRSHTGVSRYGDVWELIRVSTSFSVIRRCW